VVLQALKGAVNNPGLVASKADWAAVNEARDREYTLDDVGMPNMM